MKTKTLCGIVWSTCLLMASCSDHSCDGIEYDGQCIPKSELENVGIDNNESTKDLCRFDVDCQIDHALSVSCVPGDDGAKHCIANSCETDYRVSEDNSGCIEVSQQNPNTDGCESDEDCLIEHVTSASCIPLTGLSYCEVNRCEPGYLVNDSHTGCEVDNLPDDAVCKTDEDCLTEGVSKASCHKENAPDTFCSATACLMGYHQYAGGCEKDDINNCGDHGIDCMASEGVTSATCDPDPDDINGLSCTPVCSSDYHLVNDIYGKRCEADSDWKCGEQELNCSDLPNVYKGSCENGKCVAKECYVEYTVVNGQCVDATTNDCCGDSCEKCDETQGIMCYLGLCRNICEAEGSGDLYCNGICVDSYNDTNNCGECGNVCKTDGIENALTMECVDQQCVLATCDNGLAAVNGECRPCIVFTDAELKSYALSHWDTDNDECISYEEADAVTEIKKDAFENNSRIKKIKDLSLFHNLKTIGISAFYNCKNLTEVEFPYVESIGYYGFEHCSSLESVSFPKLEWIGTEAFRYTALKNVNMPELLHVSSVSFAETPLETINFPKLESIADFAFENCRELTKATLPKANDLSEDIFNGCSKLTELIMTSSDAIENYYASYSGSAKTPWGNDHSAGTILFSTANVSLTLNPNKESEVTNGNEWMGAAWKEIKFSGE